MKTALFTGAILALICILGFIFREGFTNNGYYILALAYNRLLMGFVIGMAASKKGIIVLIRGAFLGLLVSLAFFLSTEFQDPISFTAGIIYGVIIDGVASRYSNIIIRGGQKLIKKIRGR